MHIFGINRARRGLWASLGKIAGVLGFCALLVPPNAWAVMSDDEASELIKAMYQQNDSYEDIVVSLMVDGRSLPRATEITVRTIKPYQERMQVARTVLCMSKDLDEAEEVTNAAISAVPPGDAIINEFVSEFVKYKRSSCLDIEILQRPPVETGLDEPVPGPTDVSPSR